MFPEALIIEDDEAQGEIFSRAVTQAGYKVTLLHDGAKALDYLQMHTPRLIVLDLHLPGQNGQHLARAIRAMPHLQNVRLILATADDRLAETLHDLSDLVLLKPISYTQLRDLAARLRAG
ncbi:MAG: PleD family two-component system response regulator [Anaerolineales bacterium]